ncbi:hypothetical protein C7S15_4883 [Burkholderia cepacia]|nr:hypothetical protein [Burkholderia cepacia]
MKSGLPTITIIDKGTGLGRRISRVSRARLRFFPSIHCAHRRRKRQAPFFPALHGEARHPV